MSFSLSTGWDLNIGIFDDRPGDVSTCSSIKLSLLHLFLVGSRVLLAPVGGDKVGRLLPVVVRDQVRHDGVAVRMKGDARVMSPVLESGGMSRASAGWTSWTMA